MRCFINRSDFVKQAYKVYDEIPEDVPDIFKKSKLVCFDEVKLSVIAGHGVVQVNKHSFTDKKRMKVYLTGMDECSVEEFDNLYNRCEKLLKEMKEFDKLK